MKKNKILVVDDEKMVRDVLSLHLQKYGYETVVVGSGQSALELIQREEFDLIITDIRMPEMDGIQFAEQIRSRFDIPVVYLTGYSDEEILQQAKITEPYGYILKPFNDRELKANIEMVLYKHRMDKKVREREERYRILFNGVYNFLETEKEGTTWTTKLFRWWKGR